MKKMSGYNNKTKQTTEEVVKFQDLPVDVRYTVDIIRKMPNSKYGDGYMMQVHRDDDCDTKIKIWSSTGIAKYIKEDKIIQRKKSFTFTVRESTSGDSVGKLYADIEDYKKDDDGWVVLK